MLPSVNETSNCGFKGQFSLRPDLIFKVKQGKGRKSVCQVKNPKAKYFNSVLVRQLGSPAERQSRGKMNQNFSPRFIGSNTSQKPSDLPALLSSPGQLRGTHRTLLGERLPPAQSRSGIAVPLSVATETAMMSSPQMRR